MKTASFWVVWSSFPFHYVIGLFAISVRREPD